MIIEWNRYKRDFQHLGSRVDCYNLPKPCITCTKNVELVDGWQWSASHVLVKLQDGTKVRVPMNSVKMIKC
jgi:hypothetical protein